MLGVDIRISAGCTTERRCLSVGYMSIMVGGGLTFFSFSCLMCSKRV